MRRIPLVDALRAVAALLVVLTHVGFWSGATAMGAVGGVLARGDSGVAVFFVISAFLLGRPWVDLALGGDGPRPGLGSYAVRRAARILPAYWLALTGVIVVAAVLDDQEVGSVSTVLSHVLLLQGLTGETYQSFSQTWSLTTEVCFYLVLPALGLAALRVTRGARSAAVAGRRLLLWLALIGMVGLAVQGWAAALVAEHPGSGWGALTTSLPAHLLWFATGLALAVIDRLAGLPGAQVGWRRWYRVAVTSPGTVLGAAAVVLLVSSTSVAGPRDLAAPTVFEAVAKEVLYAVLAGLLMCAALTRPDASTVSHAVATSRWTRRAGDVSYGVFLWHVLVLQVLFAGSALTLFSAPWLLVLVAVLVASLAIAWVSFRAVEQPFIAVAHRSAGGSRLPVRTR